MTDPFPSKCRVSGSSNKDPDPIHGVSYVDTEDWISGNFEKQIFVLGLCIYYLWLDKCWTTVRNTGSNTVSNTRPFKYFITSEHVQCRWWFLGAQDLPTCVPYFHMAMLNCVVWYAARHNGLLVSAWIYVLIRKLGLPVPVAAPSKAPRLLR
jgi:hypothetical protein